ncbi:MAG: P-II family nitrogen regulator [Terracidiphilus sp.]
MKRIDAVIRPERLDQVKKCLSSIGIQGASAAEIRGFGRQHGHTEIYRGTEYSVDFLPKVLLTIVASDEQVSKIVDAIIEGSRTGKLGDGKIFVTPVDEVIRIRTGERGETAL